MRTPTDKLWHQLPAEEVIQTRGVDPANGLAAEEVRRRQQESGANRVTARRGPSAWRPFLQQFNQPLVYILLLAVGVTAVLGEWVDSMVIFGVVLINAIAGLLQETKAEKAVAALAQMVTTDASVRRDGQNDQGQGICRQIDVLSPLVFDGRKREAATRPPSASWSRSDLARARFTGKHGSRYCLPSFLIGQS